MSSKSKSIPHGINYLRYMTGQSRSKKHPEKINFICCHNLPEGLDAKGVWESMQATTARYDKLKNTLIKIEYSPPKEYTAHFTREDWKKLWNDFLEEFDSQTILDKNGKVTSRPTNLSGSKGIVYLHEESKGGIPHLHGGFCRVDENGNVNNDHDIHLRAQRADEAVARKRGWLTPMDVRTKNLKHVIAICEDILKSMPRWSWNDYVTRIESVKDANLKVKTRTDSLGNIKGYSIVSGNTKYKSSELDRGLTYSRLSATWWRLHPIVKTEPEESPVARKPIDSPKPMPVVPIKKKPIVSERKPKPMPIPEQEKRTPAPSRPDSTYDYSFWTPDRKSVDLEVDGISRQCFLPKNVLQLFDDIFDYRESENFEPLTNLACAYFAGMMPSGRYVSTGGVGTTNNTGWRDKDEDDIEFARRCAQMAKKKIGFKKKSRGFHR